MPFYCKIGIVLKTIYIRNESQIKPCIFVANKFVYQKFWYIQLYQTRSIPWMRSFSLNFSINWILIRKKIFSHREKQIHKIYHFQSTISKYFDKFSHKIEKNFTWLTRFRSCKIRTVRFSDYESTERNVKHR